MAKSEKGGRFERELSADLSRWWADDEGVDDLFWRSSTSGGRATIRRRANKSTRGHCGDLTATDPFSKPLTDLVTIEAKRGYLKSSLNTLMDRNSTDLPQKSNFDGWVNQAIAAMENAGSHSWALIVRRDKKQALIFFPFDLMQRFHGDECFPKPVCPFMTLDFRIRYQDEAGKWKKRRLLIVGMLLKTFKKHVKRQNVLRILTVLNKERSNHGREKRSLLPHRRLSG